MNLIFLTKIIVINFCVSSNLRNFPFVKAISIKIMKKIEPKYFIFSKQDLLTSKILLMMFEQCLIFIFNTHTTKNNNLNSLTQYNNFFIQIYIILTRRYVMCTLMFNTSKRAWMKKVYYNNNNNKNKNNRL
jgi:hypothetical protein